MRDSDWKILYELYLTKNITRVAEKLFMTQPTLTKRIQYIEEEFQTRIVNRSTKGVTFTKEGEYLAHQAELYLQFRGGVDRRMEAFKEEGIGTIRVASSLTFGKQYLPGLIKEYQKTYPYVSFDVQSARSNFLAQFLTDGTSDIAFVRGEYDCDLYKKKLLLEQAYLVSVSPVSVKDLLSIRRIDGILAEASRKILDQWWNENFEEIPKASVTVRFVDVAWEMVKQGLGYMIGFFEEEVLQRERVWYQPIYFADGRPVERGTWMIYSREIERAPFVNAFIQLVEETF